MADAHVVAEVISGKGATTPNRTRKRHTISLCVSCRSVWLRWNVRRRSRVPRLPAGGFGARTARENGDSQECARELDAGPGCYRMTNATGAWSDHRSPPHVQGSRLQCVSIVAIKGGKVPIDAGSLVTSCEHDKGFEEPDDIAALENTQALVQVKIQAMVEDIDRIFFADSHGIFVAFEDECAEIVTRLYAAGKVEAVVCNDTTGLVGAKDSAGPLVRCGSSLVLWRVAGIWMEEPAQRTQVGHQRAVIELHQDRLMRQHTLDADRAARVPVTPTAQDTRAHLVDLRVGNKPETFAGESHDWKGRQKAAGFSNDEEKTVGLYGKVLNVLEIKFEELGAKYVEGETFKRDTVRDERLVAGQNPMSSVTCAGLALESLEWFFEAGFSVPLYQACKGTFFCGGMLFRRTLAPTMKRYVDEALFMFREEERFYRCMFEVLGAAGFSDETYKKKANNHMATAFEEAHTNSSVGTMVAASPEFAMIHEFIRG